MQGGRSYVFGARTAVWHGWLAQPWRKARDASHGWTSQPCHVARCNLDLLKQGREPCFMTG